jgi:hypothetical protein
MIRTSAVRAPSAAFAACASFTVVIALPSPA